MLSRLFAFLALILFLPTVSHSRSVLLVPGVEVVFSGPPEGPDKSGPGGVSMNDDGNKTSIWKNLWIYYKKCREWAKTYVMGLNAVSDLLYGTYEMLKKWEDIAKKVEFLTSTNPFDGKGVVDRVENAEMWFRTSDELFFEDIPTAMKKRQMLSKQASSLVGMFRGGANAIVGSNEAQAYAESYRKGYLASRSIHRTPGKDGRVFMSAEDEMLQQLITRNADVMARLHEQSMLLQQEDAVSKSVGMDLYEMVNCTDAAICGGISERSDAENRLSILDQRRSQLARRQSEYTTSLKLQDILSATQVYVTQGVVTTAYLGALIRFQKELCDANGLTSEKLTMPSYKWGALYPHAYQYTGKIYGPDIHYYDSYK